MGKLKTATVFQDQQVNNVFSQYPEQIQSKLLFIRELIFNIASNLDEVGAIQETLKWGEPSYVTCDTNSGSTCRIGWKKSTPEKYYVYFNCKTTLVDTFKEIYGPLFTYGGNRSLIFDIHEEIPAAELSDCIAIALTYHSSKKRK